MIPTIATPNAPILEGALASFREQEIRLLDEIASAIDDLGLEASDDRQRLRDLAQDLRDLFFLIVVIGEFNAGKSSFINALLGDDFLPTGVLPTTEMIELVRYGERNSKPTIRDESTREWSHPGTGAAGVALVDTPGTGSVFQKHEKTAKAFLHRSDLVIFVLSAKRALAEAERLYLELAKQYGKKIILVVNQVDLLSPNEQAEVRRFVERQVNELLDLHPLIFMVSARDAIAARKAGLPEAGGIDAVRAHLRGVLGERVPAQQKLFTALDFADRIVAKYGDAVQGRARLVQTDSTKVYDVQRELEAQSQGMSGQLAAARAEIDRTLEGVRTRGLAFINRNLTVRRLGRNVNREVLQAEFQEVVIGRALQDIEAASTDYVNALVDSSRQYWRGVIERLNQLRELLEQEVTGLDASIYAEQREALQDAINAAESELRSYSTGRVIGDLETAFRENMNGFTTSAATAIAGLIISLVALATPGALTVFPLAALAFTIAAPITVIGAGAAVVYYRRVSAQTRAEFSRRVDQLENTYHEALDTLTQKERNRLTQYGRQVLTPIFSRLDVVAQRYAAQQAAIDSLSKQSATLRSGIQALVK